MELAIPLDGAETLGLRLPDRPLSADEWRLACRTLALWFPAFPAAHAGASPAAPARDGPPPPAPRPLPPPPEGGMRRQFGPLTLVQRALCRELVEGHNTGSASWAPELARFRRETGRSIGQATLLKYGSPDPAAVADPDDPDDPDEGDDDEGDGPDAEGVRVPGAPFSLAGDARG